MEYILKSSKLNTYNENYDEWDFIKSFSGQFKIFIFLEMEAIFEGVQTYRI